MFAERPALDTSTKATSQLPAVKQHVLIKSQTLNKPVCCRSLGVWTEAEAVTQRVQSGAWGPSEMEVSLHRQLDPRVSIGR